MSDHDRPPDKEETRCCYTLALMCIYPWRSITPDQSPFVQVFENIGIPAAAGIINFVVLTAAASACNRSCDTDHFDPDKAKCYHLK